LGILGGDFAMATWLNNAGEAVGGSTTTNDDSFHATLWKKGRITDLGTLDGDCFSIANSINAETQIIGQSFSCPDASISRAVIWDKGSILDLNTAIPPDPTLQLTEALNINDRGEIVGRGLPVGCYDLDLCGRVFLLIPCDRPGVESCSSSPDLDARRGRATLATTVPPIPDSQSTKQFVERRRMRVIRPYQTLGLPRSKGQ
jgi:probable HAF family extracellular repeat protein